MRVLGVIMVSLLMTASGFAENMAVPATAIILSKVTSGGMTPPEMYGWGSEVLVYGDGKVVERYRPNGTTPWKTVEIAKLSALAVDEILTSLNDIAVGQLVFPDEPRCTDIPRTSYKGLNGENAFIEFAANEACLSGYLDGYNDADWLQRVIDVFDSLSIER